MFLKRKSVALSQDILIGNMGQCFSCRLPDSRHSTNDTRCSLSSHKFDIIEERLSSLDLILRCGILLYIAIVHVREDISKPEAHSKLGLGMGGYVE